MESRESIQKSNLEVFEKTFPFLLIIIHNIKYREFLHSVNEE